MKAVECFGSYGQISHRIENLLKVIPSQCDLDLVMRAWEEGGLLSLGWNEGKLERIWINVIAHQAMTAVFANQLCIRAKGRFTEKEIVNVVTGALIHDAYKRCESEAHKKAVESGVNAIKANNETEQAGHDFLSRLGFSDQVVSIASATGDHGLELMRGRAKNIVTLDRIIMFYADACVSGDKVIGYTARFDDLLKEFMPGGRYHHLQIGYLQKYGRTNREVWDETVIPLQEELATTLNMDPDKIHLICEGW